MSQRIRLHRLALAALLLTSLGTAFAQDKAPEKVLKGKDVTENNLVDALAPPEGEVLTRSLKVSRVSSGSEQQQPKKKPSASLLITFATNSADLQPKAKEQLDVVAAALKNERLKDYTFEVEGHADPRGNKDTNLALSQQRAESVMRYLVSQHGIAEARLHATGKGDAELMNTKDITAPENRRVTIVTNVQAQ